VTAMSTLSLPLTELIHGNLSLLMQFSFSRRPLEELMESRFRGEWKYLNKALFSMATARAERACIELAMYVRMLDDTQRISEYLRQTKSLGFGRLIMKDKSDKELTMRDFANKVIHARAFRWDFNDEQNPILVCESHEQDKWVRAEVKVVSVAFFCGTLMS
jgi:hypothetical protein